MAPRPQHSRASSRVQPEITVESIEKQKKQFFKSFNQEHVKFVGAIENAAAKKHELDPKIFEKIADIDTELHPQLAAELDAAFQNSTVADLAKDVNKIKIKYANLLHEKVLAAYPEHGGEALRAVTKAMTPGGIGSDLMKYVHTEENGTQFGGIIGAAIAGFIGFKLTAGAGLFTNVLGTLAMGAMGAYFAHKYIDPKPEVHPIPDFHTKNQVPGVHRARQREVDYGDMIRRGPSAPIVPPDANSMNIKVEPLGAEPGIPGR